MKSAKDKNREVRKNNKVLLTDWKECYLGDYMELISGQHLVPGEYNEEKVGIPYFTGPSDFTNEIDKIIKWTNKKTKHAIVEDVLITVKGSGVGQLHFLEIEKPVAIGRQLMAIRRKNSNARFLYYLLLFKGYQIEVLSRGNMIPGVTRDDIIKLKVLFPPVPEQQKIARILSTWDKAIEKTEQLIAQKQQLKKGLMQQLLTGKVRFKEFVKSKKMKKTKLGLIPEDWILRKLKYMAHTQGGFAFKSSLFQSTGDFQVVKMSNLYSGILDLNRSKSFLSIDSAQKEYIINKNDILLTLTGTVGKRDYGHTIFINKNEKLLLNQRVARLISNGNEVDAEYLFYYTKTKKFQDQFFLSSVGGTGNQANVSISDLNLIDVPVPSILEQQRISRVLKVCDIEIDTLSKSLIELENQKKGLIQQLLTGKIRVKLN